MKGNVQDLITIPIVIFAIVMAWPAIFSLAADYVPALKASPLGDSATSATILDTTAALFRTFDNIFILVAVGTGIAAFVSAYFVDSHPAFFFVSIIVFLIAMMIVPMLANVYNDYIQTLAVSSTSGFDTARDMPIMTTIIQNFGLYALGLFGMVGLGLYVKFARGAE